MDSVPTLASILIEQGPVYFALFVMLLTFGLVAYGGAKVVVPLGASMKRFSDEQQELRKEQKSFYDEVSASLKRRVEGLETSLLESRKEREASDEENTRKIANLTRTVEEQAREIAVLRKEIAQRDLKIAELTKQLATEKTARAEEVEGLKGRIRALEPKEEKKDG